MQSGFSCGLVLAPTMEPQAHSAPAESPLEGTARPHAPAFAHPGLTTRNSLFPTFILFCAKLLLIHPSRPNSTNIPHFTLTFEALPLFCPIVLASLCKPFFAPHYYHHHLCTHELSSTKPQARLVQSPKYTRCSSKFGFE